MRIDYKKLTPETRVLEAYPELKANPVFSKPIVGFDKNYSNKILIYILWCFGKDSPIEEINDIRKRKVECAMRVGWKQNAKGKFSEAIEKILDYQDSAVNVMICEFFKIQRSRTWEMYFSNRETFAQVQAELREKIDSDLDPDKRLKAHELKMKLVINSKLLHESLEVLEEELFHKEEELIGVVSDLKESEFRVGPAERFAK
jgi:uncharacterized protein YcgL (UPF0745 family)